MRAVFIGPMCMPDGMCDEVAIEAGKADVFFDLVRRSGCGRCGASQDEK